MKKILRALGVAGLVGLATATLASCGEEGGSDKTIVFYNTMGETLQVPLKNAIADFEAKFPGWTVESNQVGGYDEVKSAIVGDLQAGSQPDLAYCYADHVAQYLVTSKVVNMADFINSTETLTANIVVDGATVSKTFEGEIIGYTEAEVNDFVKGYYDEGYASNYAKYANYGYEATDILTLPFQKSTEILYYNADALKDLGAEVPTTWDQLWDICRDAKAKWPGSTPLGYDSESNWFITMCQQNGWGYTSAEEGNYYLFNNENTIKWLTDLRAYKQEGLFTTQEIYGSYSSNLFKLGVGNADGKDGSIFSIGSSGGASHQSTSKFNWGVAPIPGSMVNGELHADAISQGPSLVMFETAYENAEERKLMTWEFVKILMDPEFQCKFAGTSGYMPSRISAYEVPSYQELLEDDTNIVVATVLCAKEMTDRFYTSPAFVGSSTARDQVGTALMYAAMGTKTPAQALADAAKKCGA